MKRKITTKRNLDKENIYIIGDSIYDIECARRIEAVSIGVATGWAEYGMLQSKEPDYCI